VLKMTADELRHSNNSRLAYLILGRSDLKQRLPLSVEDLDTHYVGGIVWPPVSGHSSECILGL
jgi:hypothetical protein